MVSCNEIVAFKIFFNGSCEAFCFAMEPARLQPNTLVLPRQPLICLFNPTPPHATPKSFFSHAELNIQNIWYGGSDSICVQSYNAVQKWRTRREGGMAKWIAYCFLRETSRRLGTVPNFGYTAFVYFFSTFLRHKHGGSNRSKVTGEPFDLSPCHQLMLRAQGQGKLY